MKSRSNYLLLIILVPLLVACDNFFGDVSNNDNNNYRVDIVTVKNPNLNSKFSFVLDNNLLYQVTQTADSTFKPKDGQRIIASYNILSVTKVDSTFNRSVKLLDASLILTKNIFNLTPATADSIGHDSIYIRDLWIGNDYLNIEFAYLGNNKTHFINLVSDPTKVYTDGKVHLEFRHNGNKDIPTYYLKGLVSFNLKSLQVGATLKTLNLVIHVKVPNQTVEKIYDIAYTFGPTSNVYVSPGYQSLMKIVNKAR